MPVRALFEAPTIAALALDVEQRLRERDGRQPAPPLVRRVQATGEAGSEMVPLSYAQQRLWFLDQLEPESATYNVPMAVRLRGELDVEALNFALTQLVRRHEVLRTRIEAEAGRPYQVIEEAQAVELEVEECGAEGEEKAREVAQAEAAKAFDLARGPLWRVRLLKVEEREHVLVVVLHHIISDGWSTGVLVKEFAGHYEGYRQVQWGGMMEVEVQYGDYARWQREWLEGGEIERQMGYWREQLGGMPERMELGERKSGRGAEEKGAEEQAIGGEQRYEIGEEEWGGVCEVSRRGGVTPFMVMVGAFKVMLWRYTSQTDIVIGTDVANRNRTELEGLIGFFANQLVLRTDLSGDPTFIELLERVRETCLGAYAHQDMPFEKLVEALHAGRDLSRNPLFQVMFVFQNVPMPALELPGLSLSLFETGSHPAKFDLTLFVTETKSGATITWNYNKELFDDAAITRMADRFRHLIASIIAQPEAPLHQLDFISQTEKALIEAEEKKRQDAKRNRFVKAKPKAIDLREVSVVHSEPLSTSASLPLLIRPRFNHTDLSDWASANLPLLNAQLLHHGALLFRGFNIRSPKSFERLASTLCSELYADYGDLPRTGLGGHVYASTPYPPDQPILFHNESSQMHCWPRKIFFCCLEAPTEGGATPVVDCRRVYQRLDTELRERFRRLGVMYVRNFTPGLDVSWQEFFRSEDRAEVEAYCQQAGIEYEWKEGGGLQTRRVSPAVLVHPESGEGVFFNQIQAHHVSCLAEEVRESVLRIFGEEGLPRNVYFGDGSRISVEEMDEVRRVYEEEAVDVGWEEGDVMMVENMLAAHGRRAYRGGRKVMVTMGDMFSLRQ